MKIENLDGNVKDFAIACYENNSLAELETITPTSVADETDCKEWDLTQEEWRIAVASAYSEKLEDMKNEA